MELVMSKTSESPEDKDVLQLIEESKAGDEQSFITLYMRYKKLLHGDYVKRMLNFDTSRNKQDSEDAHSILDEMFWRAILEYQPKKAKFITYLTNMIKYRFRDNVLKERIIPIHSNKSAKVIQEKIDKTQCVLHPYALDYVLAAKPDDKVVGFNIGKEKFRLAHNVFISKFIIDNLSLIIENKRNLEIYKDYIALMLEEQEQRMTKMVKKFNLTKQSITKIILDCNKKLIKSLKIENFTMID